MTCRCTHVDIISEHLLKVIKRLAVNEQSPSINRHSWSQIWKKIKLEISWSIAAILLHINYWCNTAWKFDFTLFLIRTLWVSIEGRRLLNNNRFKTIFFARDSYYLYARLAFKVHSVDWLLGVKVRNMKMDFNTEGTWHRVGQWTLMLKIIEFFYWTKSLSSNK